MNASSPTVYRASGLRVAHLSVLLSLLSFDCAAAQELQRGEVHKVVECAADASQSYALYLPSHYDKRRAWPILFGFSPDARGATVVELHREAAERFGWIVVASNNSRNGPAEDSQRAAEALWLDVNSRFQLDEARLYSAGFSGGAIVASWFAQSRPVSFAGAFLHARGDLSTLPKEDLATFFVLLPGLGGDFNLEESIRYLCLARRTSSRVHLEPQPGEHAWATSEACTGLLRYAELQAGLDPEQRPERQQVAWIKEEVEELLERLDGPFFLCAWERLGELAQKVGEQHAFGKKYGALARKYAERIELEHAAWKRLDEQCLFGAELEGRYPSVDSVKAVDRARRSLVAELPGTTAAHLALLSQLNAPLSMARFGRGGVNQEAAAAYEDYVTRASTLETDLVEAAEKLIKGGEEERAVVALYHAIALGTLEAKTLKSGVFGRLRKLSGYKALTAAARSD